MRLGILILFAGGLAACSTTNNYYGGASNDAAAAAASLGPSCDAYLECCRQIAGSDPALGSACDGAKKNIDDGLATGASASTYEAACKSGLDAVRAAGHCGGDGGSEGGASCLAPETPPYSSACDACVESRCAPEAADCFTSTADTGCDCRLLSHCMKPCGSDTTCFNACWSTHPTGSDTLNALGNCIRSKCSAECP